MSLFGLLPDGVLQAADQAGSLDLPPTTPVHRSPLGIGGRFRDILGGIGDSLLVATGHNPSYEPKRERELIGDAMQNYQQDPLGSIMEASKVNPTWGREALKNFLEERLKAIKEGREAHSAQISDQVNLGKIKDQVYGQVAGLLRDPNPATWAARKKIAEGIAQNSGVQLPIDIPDAYDANVAAQYHDTVVAPKDADVLDYRNQVLQERRDFHDRSLGLARDKYHTQAAMDAARIRMQQAGIDIGASNAFSHAEDVRTKGKGKKIGRPSAAGVGPTKPFITSGGEAYVRQPDGSYKSTSGKILKF